MSAVLPPQASVLGLFNCVTVPDTNTTSPKCDGERDQSRVDGGQLFWSSSLLVELNFAIVGPRVGVSARANLEMNEIDKCEWAPQFRMTRKGGQQ